MYNEKKALRRLWKERRASISDRSGKSDEIRRKLLTDSVVLQANSVFLYLSFGTEVETLALGRDLLAMGKRVGVPLCDPESRTMKAVELKDFQKLRPGSYGILEPNPNGILIPAAELDLALVPGLAFDRKGYRLGYGGGYYDRFLTEFSGRSVGLAFSDCLVETLPHEDFDLPVDEVITEER